MPADFFHLTHGRIESEVLQIQKKVRGLGIAQTFGAMSLLITIRQLVEQLQSFTSLSVVVTTAMALALVAIAVVQVLMANLLHNCPSAHLLPSHLSPSHPPSLNPLLDHLLEPLLDLMQVFHPSQLALLAGSGARELDFPPLGLVCPLSQKSPLMRTRSRL